MVSTPLTKHIFNNISPLDCDFGQGQGHQGQKGQKIKNARNCLKHVENRQEVGKNHPN